MKIFLLSICCFAVSVYCGAQRRQEQFIMWPTDINSEKIVFSESISAPQLSAVTLYTNAKNFLTHLFKTNRDTIIADDSAKMITCKSVFYMPIDELGERGKGFIGFTLFIACQKNFYKYSLTDLQHFPQNADGAIGGPLENEKAISNVMLLPPKYWNEQKAKCYYRIQTTLEQLKLAMQQPAEG